MTIVSGAILVAALSLGRDVFIPIVLAVILSFVLGPFVTMLRRVGLGRAPATAGVVLVTLGVLLGLGSLIGSQVAELANDLPRYRTTIAEKITTIRSATVGRASGMLRDLGREVATAAQEPAPGERPGSGSARAAAAADPMPVKISEPDPTPLQILRNYIGPVLGPVETAGIVLVVVVFILLQREDLRDRMIRLFGSSDLHRTTAAMDDAGRRLSRYFLTQLALNALFGVIITIGLTLIGVPNPILWGVMAALMRFVPYIGAFIAAVLPVALAAAVDPGWTMVALTLALFLVSEPVMGQAIEPLVYGHSTGLSPFAVVVSAIFWTWLWGPIGLILSTPLTVCLVVLGRHVERLEFLDVLLGDRPALTPVENFYQRILAGDPDEALEHAEGLLTTASLSAYYDDVALKGLQLAAADAMRGVLTEAQIARIREGIANLVDDLSSFDDAEPSPDGERRKRRKDDKDKGGAGSEEAVEGEEGDPDPPGPLVHLPAAWTARGAVLCVAGRGPLDEAASTMLAQLLTKNGLGARLVPHRAVARTNILGLDVEGAVMVCISYLDITGNPAHLRYLLRRLRQKLPDAPILVGLWPAGEAILTDEKLRRAVGADYYVTSLREAVQACLEAAAKVEAGEPATAPEPKAPVRPLGPGAAVTA